MFARPKPKKRSHGSNFSSSYGDNSSVGGSSDLDAMECTDSSGRDIGHNSRSGVTTNIVNNGNGIRIIRKVQSNSALNPPIPNLFHNSPEGMLRQSGHSSGRRSISGHFTPPRVSANPNYHTQSNYSPLARPSSQLPHNMQSLLNRNHLAQQNSSHQHQLSPNELAFMRSSKNSSFLNPSSPVGELLEILKRNNSTPASLHNSLNELRIYILKYGLPNEDSTMAYPVSNSIRSRAWKALLGVYNVSAGEYLELIGKGPSPMFDKVNNDTFRTLATDKKFLQRVEESMLVRVLNAQVWKTQSSLPAGTSPNHADYVQGMNVLVAPFLFVMPEVDAFFTSYTLLKVYCPTYVQPTLAGVHCGLKLMDKCLEVLDAELYQHLRSKGLRSELYAFASILTLSACTPPLDELLKLWDFLLAFGIHLNVVCTVAQIMLIRNSLLSSASPVKFLRTFPDLKAAPIIQMTRYLVKQLPDQIYDELVAHPFDSSVCDRYLNERLPDLRSSVQSLYVQTSPASSSESFSYAAPRPLVGRKR